MIYTTADNGTIKLGFVNDNEATVIQFPVANIFALFGNTGSFILLHRRPQDEAAYPVPNGQIAVDGDFLKWTLNNYDVQYSGNGECQLCYTVGDVVKMTQKWRTAVSASLVNSEIVPDPYETWLDDLTDIMERAESAADRAEDAETKTPHIGANGNWLIWDAVNEEWVDSGTSARPSFVVVGALPAEGQSGIIYLVPSADPGVENIYDEYIWVGTDYELIGTTSIDLSGYVPKTWLDGTDTVNTFQVLSDNGVSIYAETDVHISTPDARVQMSNGGLDIYGIDDVSISSDGTVEIYGYNNTIVRSSGDATVEADGDVTVRSDNGDVALSGNHATFNGKNLLTEQEDTGITDTTPYNLRAETRNAIAKKPTFVGGTVAWNQLVDFRSGSSHWRQNGTTTNTWTDGVLTISNAQTAAAYIYQNLNEKAGHKFLYFADGQTTLGAGVTLKCALSIFASGATTDITKTFDTTRTQVSGIFASATDFTNRIQFRPNNPANTLTVYACEIFDLTAMFGSTIADYIYGLGNTDGVAWFRSLFPSATYAYNAGTLMSVYTDKAKMVGFNQWDEEYEVGAYASSTGAKVNAPGRIRSKNYIRVKNNTTYYFKFGSWAPYTIYMYGANKEYIGYQNGSVDQTINIPINCCYITLNTGPNTGETYNGGICINISHAGMNGTYQAYQSKTYTLGNVTLNGLFRLDGNNLYADGDTYEHDGTITRKYASRAYQAGDESLADAITDGTTTVYKLTTPTTETAATFDEKETVYQGGTEALTDYAYEQGTRDAAIPVGHSTVYLREMIMVPAPPVLNGTYTLTATVNNGSTVIDWQ